MFNAPINAWSYRPAQSSASRQLWLVILTSFLFACQTAPSVKIPPSPENEAELGTLILADDTRRIPVDAFNHTGEAAFIWPGGRRQEGSFVDGKLDGPGKEEFAGATYEGTWQNGVRHGSGTQEYADGGRFQGFWLEGLRSGLGNMRYADGSTYSGDWVADKRQGFGVLNGRRGSHYDGSWQADKRHGYGTEFHPNYVRYEGMWAAGKRHGFGLEIRPDGATYRGQWIDDRREGSGIETYAMGAKHEGHWEADRILGTGTRTTREGIELTGAWTLNVISSGLARFPDGNEYAGPLFKKKGTEVAPQFLAWLTARAGGSDGLPPSAYAQYLLALAYLDFRLPERDEAVAKIWLEASAAQDIQDAHYRLALLLQNDNWQAAAPHLEAASTAKHPAATALLGELYHTGQHYPQDLSKAVSLYETAIAEGHLSARNNLAWLLATTETELADPKRAAEMMRPLVMYLNNWQYLDTFAAAHARLGNFDMAVAMQERAVEDAKTTSPDHSALPEMQARLELFRQSQAYRE